VVTYFPAFWIRFFFSKWNRGLDGEPMGSLLISISPVAIIFVCTGRSLRRVLPLWDQSLVGVLSNLKQKSNVLAGVLLPCSGLPY
jgi:hypothetical protein